MYLTRTRQQPSLPHILPTQWPYWTYLLGETPDSSHTLHLSSRLTSFYKNVGLSSARRSLEGKNNLVHSQPASQRPLHISFIIKRDKNSDFILLFLSLTSRGTLIRDIHMDEAHISDDWVDWEMFSAPRIKPGTDGSSLVIGSLPVPLTIPTRRGADCRTHRWKAFSRVDHF